MSMMPELWSKNPMDVVQAYNKRHGVDPPGVLWAVWAAEGLQYLEQLDGQGTDTAHPDLVDMAHVRWATGSAITALDLCAASLGRMFCNVTDRHELDLRNFDASFGSANRRTTATSRLKMLPQLFQDWVAATLADPRYLILREARNPFTHAWLKRTLYMNASADRQQRTDFELLPSQQKHNARDLVVISAELAKDRLQAFLDCIEAY